MRLFAHIFILIIVMLLVANMFYNHGAGFTTVHPYVYYAVGALIMAMPLTWACIHIGGGLLLGIASGGVLDGLRLGLILGLGMALSKLWPTAFGAGLGVFLGQGPVLYGYTGIGVGCLLFGLDKALHYFWKSTTDPKNEQL